MEMCLFEFVSFQKEISNTTMFISRFSIPSP
jgi:hypothetical protein